MRAGLCMALVILVILAHASDEASYVSGTELYVDGGVAQI